MEIEYLKTEEDIEKVYKLLNKYSDEIGFVMKNIIRNNAIKRENIIIKDDDRIISSCNFHKRKDGITTIYEIAVDKEYRGKGIGKEMIKFLVDKGHNIKLKCPIDNESNKFYEKIGAKLIGIQKRSGKRDLKIYNININNFNC